jgi:peptidyl-prolyl cis-trans isomerase D
MLQNIGDKLKGQRWLATIILGLLALVFAIWGAYGIVNISFGTPDYGLKVNGESIPADTINRVWQERQAQYQQNLNGAEMPEAQKLQLQQQLLDEYVRQTLLRQRAQAAGYRASDAEVLAAYRSETAFQVDGQFSPTVAKAMLQQIGETPESYEAERRQGLQISQLGEGIQISDFLTPTELERIFGLENEQHAELQLDPIAKALTVKPEDLQAYYDKNQSRYGQGEQRHAHHILIAVAAPKDAKADAAALETAKQVLAQLKAGKTFEELAKKYSADPGSSALGGDLGWADKSAYVPAFADALFSMKPGQISDPVKTQFGYHIIRLDEIHPAHIRTLAEAHDQIESEYRHDQASEIFGDRQEQLEQKVESGTTTDVDALAKQFELQSGEIMQFTRSGGAAPLGGKPELISAVFSDDALSGKKIVGPVALADDRLVVFKVLEHHAAAPQPLASVHDEIIAAIRKSEGTAAAKAAADGAVKQLDAGTSLDEVLKSLRVTAAPAAYVGRSDPQLPVQVRQAAFAAPRPSGKPVNRALALDDGGAAVLTITAVKAGSTGANPQNDEQLVSEYAKRDREGEMAAYQLELQRRASIKRNPSIFQ